MNGFDSYAKPYDNTVYVPSVNNTSVAVSTSFATLVSSYDNDEDSSSLLSAKKFKVAISIVNAVSV